MNNTASRPERPLDGVVVGVEAPLGVLTRETGVLAEKL